MSGGPDPLTATQEDRVQAAIELKALTDKGQVEDLSKEELLKIVRLSRIVRKTATGPSKAKAKKTKTKLSDEELGDLLG